jgi:hypothetical protein
MIVLDEGMAREYDFVWNGIRVHCTSEDDAAALMKKLVVPDRPDLRLWSAHEFVEFTGRIQHQQRKFLWYLKEVGQSSNEEIRTALGLEGNQALAGVLSGITKVAMAMDIDHTRVYVQKIKYEQGKPIRTYDLASSFKKAAVEFDWPSESEVESF